MFNARYILKLITAYDCEWNGDSTIGPFKKYSLNEHEMEALQHINLPQDSYSITNNIARIFIKAKSNKELYTSKLYTRQKKRTNSIVSWNGGLQFGIIQCFITSNDAIFAIIQELVVDYSEPHVVHSQFRLNLHDFITPVRQTYCYHE